jgi:hypothetical protein
MYRPHAMTTMMTGPVNMARSFDDPGEPRAVTGGCFPVCFSAYVRNKKLAIDFQNSYSGVYGEPGAAARPRPDPSAVARNRGARFRTLAGGETVRATAHDAVSSGKLEHASHLRRGHHQPQLRRDEVI